MFCGSDEKPQWRKAAYTQLIPGARAWREVGIYESLARNDGWGLGAHFPEENGLWEFKFQHKEIPIVSIKGGKGTSENDSSVQKGETEWFPS